MDGQIDRWIERQKDRWISLHIHIVFCMCSVLVPATTVRKIIAARHPEFAWDVALFVLACLAKNDDAHTNWQLVRQIRTRADTYLCICIYIYINIIYIYICIAYMYCKYVLYICICKYIYIYTYVYIYVNKSIYFYVNK